MNIEVLYFEGCPNHKPTVDRLRAVLIDEGLPAFISEVEVSDKSAALDLGFPGSPTIRINGIDIDPDASDDQQPAFACRRYEGGLPSREMIRAALRSARVENDA